MKKKIYNVLAAIATLISLVGFVDATHFHKDVLDAIFWGVFFIANIVILHSEKEDGR